MNSRARALSRKYAAALRRYLSRRREALLQEAYELGRTAITRGLGVLDIARVHQRALASCLPPELSSDVKARSFEAAETFFMETLSPFEVEHRGFREANLRLHQLNDALEIRNLELDALNRDLRSLSNQILHVQEAERQRISRELHDEVGQALTAIHMNLALLERNGAVDAGLLKRKIADTQGLLRQTMETVHGFARELRPAMLDELGLLPALRSYLKAFAERTGLRARFRGNPEAEALNSEQKTVVFRVTQESLTNVARHSHASHVGVTFESRPGVLSVQIKDNGKAFRVAEQLSATGKKRLGLLGMQERVRLVNGRFAIRSSPGRGTTVRVEIPVKPGGAVSKADSSNAINHFPCKR